MQKENITYYINFVRKNFTGSREACNLFIEENLKDTVEMMDRYTAQNNPWWLNNDANMAYHQLKEFDYLIVDYASFIDALSRLLDRPIQSFEIGKNYTKLIEEAHIAYTNHVQQEVLQRYKLSTTKQSNIHQQTQMM